MSLCACGAPTGWSKSTIAPQLASVPPDPAVSRVAVSLQVSPFAAHTSSHDSGLLPVPRYQQFPANETPEAGHASVSSAATSATNASTLSSMACASPLVAHPPFPSSFVKVDVSLLLHFWTFVGSAAMPVSAASASRSSRHFAFFPAALILAPAHLFCATASSPRRTVARVRPNSCRPTFCNMRRLLFVFFRR